MSYEIRNLIYDIGKRKTEVYKLTSSQPGMVIGKQLVFFLWAVLKSN